MALEFTALRQKDGGINQTVMTVPPSVFLTDPQRADSARGL